MVRTGDSWNEEQLRREADRCRQEMEHAEQRLRAGHPDVQGLVGALSDWAQELRIVEGRLGLRMEKLSKTAKQEPASG